MKSKVYKVVIGKMIGDEEYSRLSSDVVVATDVGKAMKKVPLEKDEFYEEVILIIAIDKL